MNLQDEMCASIPERQCLLDDSAPSNPAAYANRTCWQGSVPTYYINASNVSDVQYALAWAKENGIPLSIKASGHDYMGRSGGRGSLMIWMAGFEGLEYDDAFVPEGCSATVGASLVITAGSGVNMGAAYDFADEHNVTVVGGYATTISWSGGYVQGGGHSVLSPVYGLAADRVLQFKVVTPDGVLRTANACQHPDLFWALRGGGGGTFGIVLEATHQVEPVAPLVVASISFTANSTNLAPFYGIAVDNALEWASQGWGGHFRGAAMLFVNPLLDLSNAADTMASVVSYAEAQGGSATFTEFASYYNFFRDYVTSTNGAGVGSILIPNTFLMPKQVFSGTATRSQLAEFFASFIATGAIPYVSVVGPYLFKSTANSTSTLPAWRDTIWQIGTYAFWSWNNTLAERKALVETMETLGAPLQALSGSAVYSNEGNPFTSNWQASFWGENYPRLLAIKQKYDPDGVLGCFKCVGWDQQLADSSCWSAFE
ncbi:hypothetical protein SLS64_004498 [Diaporthe eres]|uniref:FAD-binding PCMH-type domain-containing protein n=1 Tax=Diaporthe eres TaxID=83184 RepID=A0ABR1PJI8_DIAER